ncbi:MAG TPA: hypothetical protein V6C90_16420 [Coleofasciculaceae cyanobacterium]
MIVKRGLSAVGQAVDEIACGGEGTGAAMSSPRRQHFDTLSDQSGGSTSTRSVTSRRRASLYSKLFNLFQLDSYFCHAALVTTL